MRPVSTTTVPPAESLTTWSSLESETRTNWLIAMFAAYAILVRLIERLAASELDNRRGLATFLIGAVVGSFMLGAVYLALWGLGMARFSGGNRIRGTGNRHHLPPVHSNGRGIAIPGRAFPRSWPRPLEASRLSADPLFSALDVLTITQRPRRLVSK